MAKVDVVGTKKMTFAGGGSVCSTRQLDPGLPVAKVDGAGTERVDFCRGRTEIVLQCQPTGPCPFYHRDE